MCAWVDHVKVSCCMWVFRVLFVGDRNLAPVSDMSSLMLAQFKTSICSFKFFPKTLDEIHTQLQPRDIFTLEYELGGSWYLLRCTCSMKADGRAWWSCRTRWRPEGSRTPQTWHCETPPACSSRWMPPGLRCKQSYPWWETRLQQIYPAGKVKNESVRCR